MIFQRLKNYLWRKKNDIISHVHDQVTKVAEFLMDSRITCFS